MRNAFNRQGTRRLLFCVGATSTQRFGALSLLAPGSDRLPFLVSEDQLMKLFAARVRKFALREDGATMVEYGLMVAVIAVVVMVGASLVGTLMAGMFNDMADIARGP